MTDPTRRNRLDEEASPYLRQHADNPVHWQPWDDAAFEAARERDVPVFLSIGYSACHWCHVMAEESFEDEDVAELLNEHFVPVKVDREERPDVDDVYMTVSQLVRGGGGWPLSAFLTPEKEPFWVGTYVPKEPKGGQPGFEQLLRDVAENWSSDRESIESRADQWATAVRGELEDVPDAPGAVPDDSLLEPAAETAVRRADRTNGGFGRQPKFPQPGRVRLLLRAAVASGRDEFRDVAVEALDAMANGGLYDHVGGGFHRYCTDVDWTVPHFEKMLYDQAELASTYLAGYQATGRERYADVVRETLSFVDRELGHPDGGFYSTLDARSEGEEGKFYVWTPDAVRDALGSDLGTLACERWGVTDSGNFEGSTVLTLDSTVSELADEYGLSAEEVRERLDEAREGLFDARAERVRPGRDEKVIGAWNGLMVSAFARAGLVLDDADAGFADRAVDALAFARDRLWNGERLARHWKDGDVKGDGFLEDYAFLARGALDAYAATGDRDHLAFALDLGGALHEAFYDPGDGTLYAAPESDDLLARPQDLTDQSTPSPTGVAVDVLLRLDAFAPDRDFEAVAESVLSTHAETIEDHPLRHVSLVDAAATRSNGLLEVTVAAEELPEAWRAALADAYRPDLLLTRRPPTDDGLTEWLDALDLDSPPAVWAERDAGDGPTAYVCRRSCSPPIRETEELEEWLDSFRVTP